VSVPAIAFYAYFRNRIARLSLEVAMASESLLDQFALGVRAVHPLANPPASSPLRTALPPRNEP
jgi:biopolymer transport protein ExbB